MLAVGATTELDTALELGLELELGLGLGLGLGLVAAEALIGLAAVLE